MTGAARGLRYDPAVTSPDLLRAIIAHADTNRRQHWAERLVSKAFGRPVASLTAGRLLVMHFEAAAGLGPRPTVTRLQQAMGHSRSVAAFIALLRGLGMVGQEADAIDARTRYLVPRPRLLDGLRTWLQGHLEGAAMVGLLAGEEIGRIDDPAFLAAFLRAARGGLDGALARIAAHPPWDWFHQHDCGDRIALRLLRLEAGLRLAPGTPPAGAPPPWPGALWLSCSATSLAADLGVSRSHVRNVLNRAEAAGLLRHDAARRAIALSPALTAAFAAWFAGELAWMAAAFRQADAAIASDACRLWTSPMAPAQPASRPRPAA